MSSKSVVLTKFEKKDNNTSFLIIREHIDFFEIGKKINSRMLRARKKIKQKYL